MHEQRVFSLRSLTAIGFLILLFYHLIGLPLAVLSFEQLYESATPVLPKDEWKVIKIPISLPYTSDWVNPDGQAGLVQDGDEFYNIVHQQYANDTLYTLLKTNQNAKANFADLAEQFQQETSSEGPSKNPLSQLIKLLKDRITIFLAPFFYALANPTSVTITGRSRFEALCLPAYAICITYHTPPPEK